MDFTTLAQLRDKLTVKHHIPGRLRLKFAASLLADPRALAVAANPPPLPEGVRSVDINLIARTMLLEYDPARIDPDRLQALVEAASDDRAAEIARELLSGA